MNNWKDRMRILRKSMFKSQMRVHATIDRSVQILYVLVKIILDAVTK